MTGVSINEVSEVERKMNGITINGNMSCKKQDENSWDKIWLQPFTPICLSAVYREVNTLNMIKGCGDYLKVPKEKCTEIERIYKVLNFTGYVIDDIQDNATLRVGVPTLHSLYGIPSTINAVIYFFLDEANKILDFHPDAITILVNETLESIKGQETEIQWRKTFICPTEKDYCDMATLKAGNITKLIIGLLQLFSTNKIDLSELCEMMGIYVQIINDYNSFKDKDEIESNGYCNDLTEGKFSFPIVHAIQNHPDGQEIMSILRQRTNDIEIKKHCVDLLERCGSFEYTRNFVKNLRNEIVKKIQGIGGNAEMIENVNNWSKHMF